MSAVATTIVIPEGYVLKLVTTYTPGAMSEFTDLEGQRCKITSCESTLRPDFHASVSFQLVKAPQEQAPGKRFLSRPVERRAKK